MALGLYTNAHGNCTNTLVALHSCSNIAGTLGHIDGVRKRMLRCIATDAMVLGVVLNSHERRYTKFGAYGLEELR